MHEQFMKELSAVLGSDLSVNDEGISAFKIGDDLFITLEFAQDYPVIYLYSPLLSLPHSESQELNLNLSLKSLELNAQLAITQGGSIAISPDARELIFCSSRQTDNLSTESFCQFLLSFIDVTKEIKTLLINPPVPFLNATQDPPTKKKNLFVIKV